MGITHTNRSYMRICHVNHRLCILRAMVPKRVFWQSLRCFLLNILASNANTRSAAADDGCSRTRILTSLSHSVYASIFSLPNNPRMLRTRGRIRWAGTSVSSDRPRDGPCAPSSSDSPFNNGHEGKPAVSMCLSCTPPHFAIQLHAFVEGVVSR